MAAKMMAKPLLRTAASRTGHEALLLFIPEWMQTRHRRGWRPCHGDCTRLRYNSAAAATSSGPRGARYLSIAVLVVFLCSQTLALSIYFAMGQRAQNAPTQYGETVIPHV